MRSPPVLVAVTTTRPGAVIGWRNAPLELAVLMNATRCAESLPTSFAHSSAFRSGPGRLNAAVLPLKLPWPMSSTTTPSFGFARAAMSATAFSTHSRAARRSDRDVMFASGTLSFFVAASMIDSAHFAVAPGTSAWTTEAQVAADATAVMTTRVLDSAITKITSQLYVTFPASPCSSTGTPVRFVNACNKS